MRLHTSSAVTLLLPMLASTSPLATTTNLPPQPTPTPSLSPSPALNPLSWHPVSTLLLLSTPTNSPNPPQTPNLDLREIVNNPAAAQPPNPTQVSPVTTLMLWQTVAPGAPAQQIQVVYSQVFASVPDQWDAPQAGELGLGRIKGSIGVVKTAHKRDALPTGTPVRREAEAEAEPDALFILPPGDEGRATQGLEKRKAGTAGRVAVMDAGPPTLALLIAVVAAMVL